MIIQEPLQAAIWHCLNNYDYQDATFLAERLLAEVDSDDAVFLLATCYYRSGKTGQAYSIMRKRGTNTPQSRYLMARCCLELQKLAEAEYMLLGPNGSRAKALDDLVTEFGDQACFALQILARIFRLTERSPKSAEAYRRALKLNPFLWHAFEELCNSGEKPDPVRTFQVTHLENFTMCQGNNPILNYVNNFENHSDAAFLSIHSTPSQSFNSMSMPGTKLFSMEDSPLLSTTMCSGVSGICTLTASLAKANRFRTMFDGGGNGNHIIPASVPSFGLLPLLDATSNDQLQSGILSQTLAEANDQKSLAKRVSSLRAQVGLMSRKETPLQQSKPVFSQSSNTSNSSNIVATSSPSVPPVPLQPGLNVRRSSRLFSNSYSVKENNKSPNRGKFATPKSPSRKSKSRIAKANLNKATFSDLNERNRNEKEKSETITSTDSKIINGGCTQSAAHHALMLQKQSVEGLMSLLRHIGAAYLHLAQYNCRKALEVFNSLPPKHYSTGWILSLMGKAHFELAEYNMAARFFSEVRAREPYRCQMMEIYSTALWHLQREVALSSLSQDLVSQERNSPEAWCAAGNCFSLQKEHDSAIKFFQRAVQIDPSFVYAYTLLGHEYVTTEELDKAMSCFRSAIRIDSRHYNAWYSATSTLSTVCKCLLEHVPFHFHTLYLSSGYGIGTIFSKQERYLLAELHYRRALSIHPHSSVLMCHVGVVQHALLKTEKALQTLNAAIANDPKNPLCKFHRASIYFAAGRHAEALKELEELKEIVPKESLVYYLTGKVHKKLGNTHLALMHFSWATDLDPKGANSHIKDAVDPSMSRNSGEEDFGHSGASPCSAVSVPFLYPHYSCHVT
ncbi:cell division cycle protein 27 homolog isoform X2 [Anabrus simplex]|uniref:cell division cycle protein 27 homolog isoform X2 n=1 Tax=Anabrus simplex TaxID=316456 RepID=UPI0035A3D175